MKHVSRTCAQAPAKPRIILASGSIWRKRLLKRHGINARVWVPHFKERTRAASPRALVLYNAVGKALQARPHFPKDVVIGVDTIGVLGKWIITKPTGRLSAARMLRRLAGTTHYVVTGLCVLFRGRKTMVVEKTAVTFRRIGEDELTRYLDSGQWKGKAGAYAIQGRAKGFVDHIDGDITSVIGLPIERLRAILKKIHCI